MMSRPLRTALLSLALGATSVLPAVATDAQVCPALDSGRVATTGGPLTVTVDAPAGQVIMSYCVAAGSGDGPELIAVDPGVETLLISHPSGMPIDHWSVTYGTVAGPTDAPPAETWWPASPSVPVGEVPPAAPAPAPVAEPAQPVDLAVPAPAPAAVATASALPEPARAVGRPSKAAPTSTSPSNAARVNVPSGPAASGAPAVPARPEAAASPVLPKPAAVPSAAVPSAGGAAVKTPAQDQGVDPSRREARPRAAARLASEVAPAAASAVRTSGFAADSDLGAGAAALLMLGLLGSTAAALHVARREPAPH